MSRSLSTVVVANRGEIARRIMRTCRAMGLRSVGLYSDPDRRSPHVREADEAFRLPGATPADTYLDVGKVIDVAHRSGADAVHPGYGFVSENADAAQACIDAGLVWVGPSPAAIRAMASKVESKRLVGGVGVPLLPSATIEGDHVDEWRRAAATVGYPLLVKASAGGGGKGMRRVDGPDTLADAIRAGRREAAAAFGDPSTFLERLVDRPRHVEVQVIGDHEGGLLHLFERDCSIQRRHQKVVEEAPAPRLHGDLRTRLHEWALSAARVIGYSSAGTVEFLVTGDEAFFLEMNTRLQVEHPVTEMITGLDLVRLQLEIAGGAPLALRQEDVVAAGHAVEVRLYAEDPAHDYRPSTGVLHRFDLDPAPGVRLDAGVESGSEVSAHYDPMLAKVIAGGETREEAARRLAHALRRLRVHGVTTNRDALVAVLEHPAFRSGAVHTGFLEEHPAVLRPEPPSGVRHVHAVAAALALRRRRRDAMHLPPVAPAGWRNVPAGPSVMTFATASGEEIAVRLGATTASGVAVEVGDTALAVDVVEVGEHVICLDMGDRQHVVAVHSADGRHWANGLGWQTELVECPRLPAESGEVAGVGPTAPVPGTILLVAVEPGDTVSAGQLLVLLEAMKMEHRIVADADGVVSNVLVKVGDQVDAHQLLIELGAGSDV